MVESLKLFNVFAASKRVEHYQYATMELSKNTEDISETKGVISGQEISYECDSLSYQPVEVAPSKGMLAWYWGFLIINTFSKNILKQVIEQKHPFGLLLGNSISYNSNANQTKNIFSTEKKSCSYFFSKFAVLFFYCIYCESLTLKAKRL